MGSVYGESKQKEIALRVLAGESKAALSKEYNVSPRSIGRYCDKWKDDLVAETNTTARYQGIEENQYTYSFTVTPEAICIIRGDGADVEMVKVNRNEHPEQYDRTMFFCKDYMDCEMEEVLEEAFDDLNVETSIQNATQGRVTADIKNGDLWYTSDTGRRVEFAGKLVHRVMNAIRSGDGEKILKFADRLSHNPSSRALLGLYDFLDAADIQINDDGMLVCYKYVTEDFMDCHTRSFDNSVGSTVEMNRNEVDEDPDSLCSRGLHVCSLAYLGSFYGNTVVRVIVDPADVVAVPEDYYGIDGQGNVKAKMRVCKYYVDGVVN